MARVSLRCKCGWMFFVSDADTKTVRCPSCGQAVGVNAPAGPVRPKTSRAVVSQGPDPRKLKLAVGVFSGVAALLILVVILVVTSDDEKEAPPANPYETAPTPETGTPKKSDETAKTDPHASDTDMSPKTDTRKTDTPKTDVPKTDTTPPPLPGDLVAQIREQLLSLPAFYLNLCTTSDDRGRVEKLLASGRGAKEDADFLRGLLKSENFKIVREELESIRAAYSKLETEALEQLPLDRLVMTDGRTLDGRVLDESGDVVKFERRVGGVAAGMNFKRDQIREVQKGRGIGAEFKTRYEAAKKGSVPDQAALIPWCKENGLAPQAKLVSYYMLRSDPGNETARAEAGLGKDPIKAAAEEAAAGPMIEYEGRKWKPKDLKEKLLRDGYAILNGQWYSKKDRTISVPGLFKYENQDKKPVVVTITDAPLNHDVEVTFKQVYDVKANQYREDEDRKLIRRFYAPTLSVETKNKGKSQNSTAEKDEVILEDKPNPEPGEELKGEVILSVPVGAPILEASVMTRAETKNGGQIIVYLAEGERGEQRTRLFQATAKEDDLHKLPATVRGSASLEFVVTITMGAGYTKKTERRKVQGLKKDKQGRILQKEIEHIHTRLIPDYNAVLFPSNSNTLEVFRLKVTVGEPAAGLNKLFADAGAGNILK